MRGNLVLSIINYPNPWGGEEIPSSAECRARRMRRDVGPLKKKQWEKRRGAGNHDYSELKAEDS